METSLKGHMLPTSQQEFADNAIHMQHLSCVFCRQPFTGDNVLTRAGWKETQISGICESCFDQMFKDED